MSSRSRFPLPWRARPPALAHRDFRRYLAARLTWATALQMLSVAVGFQVYDVTRNPLDLGLVGLSQFLPFVVLALPAGHVADAFDRRRLLVLAGGVMAAAAAGLAVLTADGVRDAGPILAMMAVLGAARAFTGPASQSIVPNLVPREHFGNATAISSSAFQVATIVGPAVGGLLLLIGPTTVYLVVAAMLVVAMLLVASLRAGGRGDAVREPLSVSSLLSGVRFVRSRPIVLGSISLDLFAVLLGGATALLPIYAADILHVGPDGLGLLRAAPALGATACAAWLAVRPVERAVGRWLFAMVAAFGVGTIVFALSTSFLLTFAALVVMGSTDMVSVFIRHVVVQLATPDAIRGRVSAVNSVFINASNELGEFESGLTASWWGPVGAAVVGGVATIGVAVAWALRFPALRRLDRFPEPDREAAPVAE
ncbi:MAG TPA: MFS transporter [Candidatus Limnocylindria bacterium]|nr:MFS transporter [Candidatus Limnocylindria bacterium]